MTNYFFRRITLFLAVIALFSLSLAAQRGMHWSSRGDSYFTSEEGGIVRYDLPSLSPVEVVKATDLKPDVVGSPLRIQDFSFSEDGNKLLIFTNSRRVWRRNTRGDYWVYDLRSKELKKLGKDRPPSSLMFAKLSPDGTKAAYVSERNLYVEDLASGRIKRLTDTNGTPKLINGTFDWVYEEEFNCRDGFRWSPDSKRIAYWQVDANKIRDYYMLNTTDSVYSQVMPVEYPKVGYPPSPVRIGVVSIDDAQTKWMNVPGDPAEHYIVRMEWFPNGDEIILQQLNRRQNQSVIYRCNATYGDAKAIFTDTDKAWVSTLNEWLGTETGWFWLDEGKSFLWMSEKDGWRHLYRISTKGKKETLLTSGKYDVMGIARVDEAGGNLYFYASPLKSTQQYLYRVPLNGKGPLQLLSPAQMEGTHTYNISPSAKFARWTFHNHFTRPMSAWVKLPDHQPLNGEEDLAKLYDPAAAKDSRVELFEITTEEGVSVDGWMVKPKNFDPGKRYPVLFYVYSYPGTHTVYDGWGLGRSSIYNGDLAEDGYLYISLDNRGSDLPKGRAWRKAIYRNMGRVNSRDQALAARQIMQWPFVDTARVAVWGWSGGGSTTLDLLFRYPEIYKVGIAVAPLTNLLLYDNIYTERFMGLPSENMEDYLEGSATTYAKNLKGELLLVHGTGDDNVHYQNAEVLINELVKHGKLFRMMAYPMRSHGIFEGEGTREHLRKMCTQFLRTHCPPGAVE